MNEETELQFEEEESEYKYTLEEQYYSEDESSIYTYQDMMGDI